MKQAQQKQAGLKSVKVKKVKGKSEDEGRALLSSLLPFEAR
jgi:hypothetical protein